MSLTINSVALVETIDRGHFTTPSGVVRDVKTETTRLKNGGIRLFVSVQRPYSAGEGDAATVGRETAQLVCIGTPSQDETVEAARIAARDDVHAMLAAIAYQLSNGTVELAARADRLVPALQDGDTLPAVTLDTP